MDSAELSSALRTVISALHKGLRKQMYSVDSYSMTEIDTIRHLMRNERLLPSELAVLAKITTQSMSQILNKMENMGIITKTRSENDKRKIYVSLTEYGRGMVKQTRCEREEWLRGQIEQKLTDDEQAMVAAILPVLRKLL